MSSGSGLAAVNAQPAVRPAAARANARAIRVVNARSLTRCLCEC